jgi:hypothetical protein
MNEDDQVEVNLSCKNDHFEFLLKTMGGLKKPEFSQLGQPSV